MNVPFYAKDYVFKPLPEPTAVPTDPTIAMWPWYIKLLFIGGFAAALAAVTVAVILFVRLGKKRRAKKTATEETKPEDTEETEKAEEAKTE